MTIGEALREIRSSKGVSAKTLSVRLGFHKSYISKIENNELIPSIEKLEIICKNLDVPQQLTSLLCLKEYHFSEAKKEIFQSIQPILIELLTDFVKNKSEFTTLNVDQELALIMKGGGIKGIAYVGAIEELSKYYNFTWYVGTSAGAISALLLACGYTIEELKEILFQKKFTDFKDAILPKAIYNLIFHRGLYRAHTFTDWMADLLAKKLNLPYEALLSDLPKRLTIYASVKNNKALIFDSKHHKTKDTKAAYAARCSMSIPFLFTPQNEQGENVYDGGMQNNYPVHILLEENPDADFIGLYLGIPTFESKSSKKGLFKDMYSIWAETTDYEALKEYRSKTVIIDTRPISTLNFKLNKLEKDFLLEAGRLAAKEYLKNNNAIQISDSELLEQKISLELTRNQIKKRRRKFRFLKLFLLPIGALILMLMYSYFKR